MSYIPLDVADLAEVSDESSLLLPRLEVLVDEDVCQCGCEIRFDVYDGYDDPEGESPEMYTSPNAPLGGQLLLNKYGEERLDIMDREDPGILKPIPDPAPTGWDTIIAVNLMTGEIEPAMWLDRIRYRADRLRYGERTD